MSNSKIETMDQAAYSKLYQQSIDQPELFWGQQAQKYLLWDKHWRDVFTGNLLEHDVRWFPGGQLNASVNCLDRHLSTHGHKIAIISEGDEPSQSQTLSYLELYQRVCRFANVLLNFGIQPGDRVCIYLPMIPEMIIAMLACARIGAIHCVIFAGFSAQALQQRILDASSRLIITADENIRGGKLIPLKHNVDKALLACPLVKQVIVIQQSGHLIDWQPSRDRWYHDLMASVPAECAPVSMEATQPLFILYTSGSTGTPKGIVHAIGGYLLHTAITFKTVFNHQSNDIYWCTADAGWITGHSYIVYGPLLNAATIVIYSGIPTYPTPARYWQIIDKHKVTIFYTAPTAIRTLMREGNQYLQSSHRESLRLLGTVGEPINPEAWCWYYEAVGEKRCSIVDTWWQTETGGIMLTPLPGITPVKPGSVGCPFFGVAAAIIDNHNSIIKNEGEGDLVITQPWPGMLQTIYQNPTRFEAAYFQKYPGYYFTGDGAVRDGDGCYWIKGRIDDVLNVSGHRLGTAEIESALTAHPKVVEAAVVDCPHPIKGQGIYAFVTLLKGELGDHQLQTELCQSVSVAIGKIAMPDKIQWVQELPKTRSGKIMRRILRKIAHQDVADLGDVSTLANPEVLLDLLENIPAKPSS